VSVERIGVTGAGTMGAGIAQIACLGGLDTHLHDPAPAALAEGEERLRAALAKGADRGRWSATEADAAAAKLRLARGLEALAGCELVIEAAPEDLRLKRELFARLETICDRDAILATNTSSLSVTAIASGLERPQRVCGMHFFNPPALMELVEIVAGEHTSEETLTAATEVGRRMGRTPIRAADGIGFLANRCIRPFSLESLRMLGEGVADHAQIDRVVRDDGGYRMGPFELMDLIGIDVNLEVARSFYSQRPEPRWEPHPIQERMVAEGRLGRKAGRGFYEYAEGDREEAAPLAEEVRGQILDRIVSQLVNEASFAADEGIGSPDDIDTAMRLGFNHPRGPFEWLEQFGARRVVAVLDGLAASLDRDRYRVADSLRRAATGATGAR
jgi:3-hydroxybutyryl-CoA dehydrogenase